MKRLLLLLFLFPSLLFASTPFPDSGFIDPGHNLSVTIAPGTVTHFPSPQPLAAPGVVTQFKTLAVLVHFPDKPGVTGSVFFDSLLFSKTQNSMYKYFKENSYGNFDVTTLSYPTNISWVRVSQPYSFYTDSNYGFGGYPNNAQKMVEEVVDLIDPLVNFSNYDNNGDGYVDALMIIHAGSGAEFTGSVNDIWSHKWAITPRLKDGVYIFNYFTGPEYWSTTVPMTVGVYCHEAGHLFFGLPDLYSVCGRGQGVGRWSLMGNGSWNGISGVGDSPAHMDAWSKIYANLVTPFNIVKDSIYSIPAVENFPVVYKLWNNTTTPKEYYLVENRQLVGYDTYLRGSGLVIWRVHDSTGGSFFFSNCYPWYPAFPPNFTAQNGDTFRYHVVPVQADSLYELERNISSGDGEDPYPGLTNNTRFDANSKPNSNWYSGYAGRPSGVSVTNISPTGSVMTARMSVTGGGAVNNPPVLNPIGDKVVISDSLLQFAVAATDPDGTTPIITEVNIPPGATFNGSQFNWTPSLSQVGDWVTTFIASDGSLSDSETITITVETTTGIPNRAPTIFPIPKQNVVYGQLVKFTVYATDPDDDPLTLTASDLPSGATFVPYGDSGLFQWTVNLTQGKPIAITFIATDPGFLTDTAVATIKIFKKSGLGAGPNPSNGGTTISYSITENGYVELRVYNLLGQEVRCLVNETKTAGDYSLYWDGTDEQGKELGTGIYFLQLRAGGFKVVERLLILK